MSAVRRGLPLLLSMLIVVISAGAPSVAAVRQESDSASEYVAADKDIRHVRYSNSRRKVTAVVDLRRLGPRSSGWVQLNMRRPDYTTWSVAAVRRANGKAWVRRQGIGPCRGLVARHDVGRDRVRFSIPQRCLRPYARRSWDMDVYAGGFPLQDANAHDGTAGRYVPHG